MKKWIALFLLLAIGMSLLTGCHGAKERLSFEIPGSFDESRSYEITFWAKNDNNAQQREIYRQAIADFQALYPNITVTMKPYSDYNLIYNDVITNIATGTTPNLCITYPDHIATYLTGENVVVPLDALMEDPNYGLGGQAVKFQSPTREEIIPAFLSECRLMGHYYAMPYMRSTEACYVNKTLVEKLGYTLPEVLTWDFVWEVSEAALKKDENGYYLVNGQRQMKPFLYKSTDNMMIQMLHQRSGGYSDDGGNIEIFNDTTTELLYQIAEHVTTGAFSTFKLDSYPGNWLNAGQCIFAVDSTAGATWMGSQAPNLDIPENQIVEFETAVLPIPQFDPENISMISQGPSMCLFNKEDPQEVLASWLFMQFLLTNPVQIAYSSTEGYIPVTSLAHQDENYQDYLSREGEDGLEHYDVKLKAAKLLLNNTENTFVTPVFNGSASLRNAAGELIETVVKSVRRKQTVDDAFLQKAYADTVSLYRLDQIQTGQQGRQEFGPLPAASVALLAGLGICWLGILAYTVKEALGAKRAQRLRS